jgi:hypothetical protein
MRFVHEPEFPGNLEIFNRFLDQHPSVPALVQEGIQESVKISDFATLSQWRRTDLYNNWFRLQGLDYQLAFLTTDPHLRLGITLNRSRCDFSEEDRSILNLLMPHLAQAFSTSKLFSHFSDAANLKETGYIVADPNGSILFSTTKAIRWLTEYFGNSHNTSLPAVLRDWLKDRSLKLFKRK